MVVLAARTGQGRGGPGCGSCHYPVGLTLAHWAFMHPPPSEVHTIKWCSKSLAARPTLHLPVWLFLPGPPDRPKPALALLNNIVGPSTQANNDVAAVVMPPQPQLACNVTRFNRTV